jgi:hypothetical protein
MKLALAVALLVAGIGVIFGESKSSDESPWQRFFREGGKQTDVEIIERDGELTTANVAQGRDLKLYENGGHVDCTHSFEKKWQVPSDCEQKVRMFVWLHWKDHRRGYIRTSGNSVDSTTTSHIFVEPATDGKWVIIIRNVNSWYGAPGGKRQMFDFPPAVSAQLVKKKRKGETTYELLLKTKTGYEVSSL